MSQLSRRIGVRPALSGVLGDAIKRWQDSTKCRAVSTVVETKYRLGRQRRWPASVFFPTSCALTITLNEDGAGRKFGIPHASSSIEAQTVHIHSRAAGSP